MILLITTSKLDFELEDFKMNHLYIFHSKMSDVEPWKLIPIAKITSIEIIPNLQHQSDFKFNVDKYLIRLLNN